MFRDAHAVAGATTTSSTAYCYDNADRLTATTVSNPVAGANPVAGTNLTSAGGAAATLQYDAHGNTTVLANETLGYDSSDRHLTTVTTGATPVSVTYIRDVTDRIVAQTIGGTTVRFGFTGGGDSPDLTMDGSSVVKERTLSLPGGVLVKKSRWLLCVGVAVLALSLEGCTVPVTGVLGLSLDGNDSPVAVIQMCTGRVDGLVIYTDGEKTTKDVLRLHFKKSGSGHSGGVNR